MQFWEPQGWNQNIIKWDVWCCDECYMQWMWIEFVWMFGWVSFTGVSLYWKVVRSVLQLSMHIGTKECSDSKKSAQGWFCGKTSAGMSQSSKKMENFGTKVSDGV